MNHGFQGFLGLAIEWSPPAHRRKSRCEVRDLVASGIHRVCKAPGMNCIWVGPFGPLVHSMWGFGGLIRNLLEPEKPENAFLAPSALLLLLQRLFEVGERVAHSERVSRGCREAHMPSIAS